MTLSSAIKRYLKEVTPSKKESTQQREVGRSKQLDSSLGQYSLAALNTDIISDFRDSRLEEGKSNNTVRLALYTAMRHGEVSNLTRQQINLEKRTILLSDTKNNESCTVPLTNKALTVINEVLNHPIRPVDTNLLFYYEPSIDKKRKPYVINKLWNQALERAEIHDLRFHDLRHEATSRFVEAGLSGQEVSSITGHKSMQMLRRYTHLRSEDLVNIISNI